MAVISPTNVTFDATFTFASAQNTSSRIRTPLPWFATLNLKLWLPALKHGDPFLENFWRLFHQHGSVYFCDSPLDESAFENSIALRVRCNNPALLPIYEPLTEASLKGRWFTDSQQGGSNWFFRLITGMDRPDSITEDDAPKWGFEPRFCTLSATCLLSADAVTNHYPVTVSYQHPLVCSK